MNKNDFLKILKEALEGQVPSGVVHENIIYYDNYINNEMNKGSKELEILDSLGDPRLIAKTIIEASSAEGSRFHGDTYYTESGNAGSSEPREDFRERGNKNIFVSSNYQGKWYMKILAVAAVILPILAIVLVFWGVTSFLFTFSGPILAILIIYLVIRRFRDH